MKNKKKISVWNKYFRSHCWRDCRLVGSAATPEALDTHIPAAIRHKSCCTCCSPVLLWGIWGGRRAHFKGKKKKKGERKEKRGKRKKKRERGGDRKKNWNTGEKKEEINEIKKEREKWENEKEAEKWGGKKRENSYRNGLCISQTAWGVILLFLLKKNPWGVMTSLYVFYLFSQTS